MFFIFLKKVLTCIPQFNISKNKQKNPLQFVGDGVQFWKVKDLRGFGNLKGEQRPSGFWKPQRSRSSDQLHTALHEGSQVFAGKQALGKKCQIKGLLGKLHLTFLIFCLEDLINQGVVAIDGYLVAIW